MCTLRSSFRHGVFVGLVSCVLGWQGDLWAQTYPHVATWPLQQPVYRLRIQGEFLVGGGLMIVAADPNGSGARLRGPLGVVSAPGTGPSPSTSIPGTTTLGVKALVIAHTTDPAISLSTLAYAENVCHLLLAIPGVEPQHVRMLAGPQVTAGNILAQVAALPVAAADTLFCYYVGHGAYDPRFAGTDPSQGHYLDLPTDDLLRSQLREQMLAKHARLTVLVTDSCNLQLPAQPTGPRAVTPTSALLDKPTLSVLFDNYAGIVDVNGSSRGQAGWSNPFGGIFTTSVCHERATDPLRRKGFLGKTTVDAVAAPTTTSGLAVTSNLE